MTQHRFTTADRFFDELLTYLVGATSVGMAGQVFLTGRVNLPKQDDYCVIEGSGKAPVDVELVYNPGYRMQEMIANRVPTVLPLLERPTRACQMTNPHDVNMPLFARSAIAAMFVHYYEKVLPLIENNRGSDCTAWPDVLNFARVVRNAYAHGAIKITNPNSPTGSWRSITYSQQDNGQDPFARDLGAAGSILLMVDADGAI